jgi:hypothetical protein
MMIVHFSGLSACPLISFDGTVFASFLGGFRMMKTIVSVLVVVCLAMPAWAGPSLGPWNEGDPGTTHAFWDFTTTYVTPITGDGYSAKPEVVSNPDPLNVVAGIAPGSTYDGATKFVSSRYISVNLEIPNYLQLNDYKEIWVDCGANVVDPCDISISITPTNIPWQAVILPAQGDAEFGVRIYPNPYIEKIGFMIWGTQANPAVLDYIHVDTICVPEPATLAILGLGGLLLRRRLA